jgi:hypothetical protein
MPDEVENVVRASIQINKTVLRLYSTLRCAHCGPRTVSYLSGAHANERMWPCCGEVTAPCLLVVKTRGSIGNDRQLAHQSIERRIYKT